MKKILIRFAVFAFLCSPGWANGTLEEEFDKLQMQLEQANVSQSVKNSALGFFSFAKSVALTSGQLPFIAMKQFYRASPSGPPRPDRLQLLSNFRPIDIT